MKKENEKRKKMIVVRLSQIEYGKFQRLFTKSACRKASEYIRNVILQKPVTIKYRNEAADEILSAFLKMKTELNALGNNFNQAVHKLHMLDRIPEFRYWLQVHGNSRLSIEQKMSEIIEWMSKIYQQWSQR